MDSDFFHYHLPDARRLARKLYYRLGRILPCDELQAAALVGLWQSACRWRPRQGPFWPYARMRIAGAVVDWVRKASCHTTTQLRQRHTRDLPRWHSLDGYRADDGALLVDTLAEPDTTVAVDEADSCRALLRQLPTRQREICRLRFVEGMKQRDVAKRLGIAESNVCKIIKESLARLRQRLPERRV